MSHPAPQALAEREAVTPALVLHPERMEVGAEGLSPFLWPVGVAELLVFRDRFASRLFQWIRSEQVERSRDAELVWLNAQQIIVEAMRLYNAAATARRLEGRAHLALPAEGQETLFHAVAADRAPVASVMTRRTLAGLPEDPSWRKALRIVKSQLRRGALPYRPRPLIRPERHIVTFSASPLILAHARAQDGPVVISKIDDWMTPGALPGSYRGGCGDIGAASLLDLLRASFADEGESLPDVLARAFASFVEALCRRTAFHLEELERQAKRLPRIFWSGTGGILYNRVMSRAVAKAGGSAVGHDHGTGTGWWQTYYQTVTELNYVDRFVTYSDALADGLRHSLRQDLLADPERLPRIEAVPRPHQAESATARAAPLSQARPSRPIKTIMYVPTAYAGDNMYLLPLLADPVAVDWQCRLLAFLKAEGYDILIKPHPESYCRPPQAFTELFGARFVDGPFETAMNQADCLLFDYLQTSCIVDAVRSDRAVVLVEFPRLTLDPQARRLLERRAGFATGWFDANGRAQVEWPSLRAAIGAAAGRDDRTFAALYFP